MKTLLIKFPDQSESFTYGVEYGRLLDRMERGDDNVSNNGFPVRVENVSLLKDTCKTFGYIGVFKPSIEGWVEFMAIKNTIRSN